MTRSFWIQVFVGLAILVVGIGSPVAQNCPANYGYPAHVMDFLDPDPKVQERIRIVESNHMNADVRALRNTTIHPSAELRFVIYVVPNHAEALTLLVRMALRDGTDQLPKVSRASEIGSSSVECWLHRATVFSPNDAMAWQSYGVYLWRRGKLEEALAAMERAEQLKPNDANVAYNLGLVYFDQRDYRRSLEYAKRAYATGFPLQGLKEKLKAAGQWSE